MPASSPVTPNLALGALNAPVEEKKGSQTPTDKLTSIVEVNIEGKALRKVSPNFFYFPEVRCTLIACLNSK